MIMAGASDKIKNSMERLHLIDKTMGYILVNPLYWNFQLIPPGISCAPEVIEADVIPLYHSEIRLYVDYFTGRNA